MSEANNMGFGDFGKWVPGFDFLQSLSKPAQNSTSAMPAMGGWVAPTLNVEDLDKRIQELKAVLFWLEQNSTALKATIQALEVQKMTLTALKGMNVSLQDMAQAFSAKPPPASSPVPPAPQPPTSATAQARAPAESPAPVKPRPAAAKSRVRSSASPAAAAGAAAAPAAGATMVDPMQWWGALTQQFQHIAQAAVADAQARKRDAAAPLQESGAAAAARKAPAKRARSKSRTQ